MSVTVIDLATYIGVTFDPETEPTQSAQLTRALGMAEVLVDDVLANAFREVPEVVRDQIVLEVAHAYFKRSDAISGSGQYAYDAGTPVFEPKDALNKVWPLIRRYVSPF